MYDRDVHQCLSHYVHINNLASIHLTLSVLIQATNWRHVRSMMAGSLWGLREELTCEDIVH